MYVTVFTGSDILKKEYQDLDKLVIPACEVEFTNLLGEGIVSLNTMHFTQDI